MTDEPYVPLSLDSEPVARLVHRIAVKVLRERNRYDLLKELDEHGGRIEDDEETGGLSVYVGAELVTRVTPEAIETGLQLQAMGESQWN